VTNLDTFFEDIDIKQALQRIIAFTVEASPLTIKDLRRQCLAVLSRELFNEITAHLSEDIVQDLINLMAIRKPYGVKSKLASIYTDTNPLALWCWEVTDTSLLEPVLKTQVEKART
jgi:hypothetical protein